MAQRELADGTIVDFTPEEESLRELNNLSSKRSQMIDAIKNEALTRITSVEPTLDSLDDLKFLRLLWPMLDITNAPANIILCRDIYILASQRIEIAKTATLEQLDSYDPSTGWPT